MCPEAPLPHAQWSTAQSASAALPMHPACSYLALIQPLHTPAREQNIRFSPQANSPETQNNAKTIKN